MAKRVTGKRDIALDEGVGQRIAEWAKRRGLRHSDLAERSGIDPSTLSNIIHGWEHAGFARLARIAKQLNVERHELLAGEGGRLGVDGGNTKPLRIGDVVVNNLYLMCGNNQEPLDLHISYTHQPIRKPGELSAVYGVLAREARQQAKVRGYPYFNGPNTRLLRVTDSKTRQLRSGPEQKGHVLELGPVSWEEYTVLNECLDKVVFKEKRRETIRRRFANRQLVFTYEKDLRWCQLSNILTVVMIPTTTDGYGLVQLRGGGVSADGDRITGGVAENIHRYLDEASKRNLRKPLHSWEPAGGLGSAQGVDSRYRPEGVPSPLLTAQRGVLEELSVDLFAHVRTRLDSFKFLTVMFDLDKFHPMLGGVIELGLTRKEVEKMIQASPGRDHTEFRATDYLPLDIKHKKTMNLIRDQGRWISTGLGAFIGAVIYSDEHGKHHN